MQLVSRGHTLFSTAYYSGNYSRTIGTGLLPPLPLLSLSASLCASLPTSLQLFRFRGLTAEHFVGVETTLEDVQQQLLHLFQSDTILLGHGLESDMRALKVWKCNSPFSS